MTGKNIFVYRLFLSLNIGFGFFYVKAATPFFPSNPSKNWDPVKPPVSFWKFGKRFNPAAERENAQYALLTQTAHKWVNIDWVC